MAWKIPEDKIIDYSPTGDDVDSFSEKVKYTLEEIVKRLPGGETSYEEISTEILTSSGIIQKMNHLQRLTENLYLALDTAQLNPGGYDKMLVATFFDNVACLDYNRSSCTIKNGKVVGDNAVLVTKPIYFESEKIRNAHLIVKHTNISVPNISAEISIYNSTDAENFVEMTKIGTYPDLSNPNRAATEFTYFGDAGNAAVLKINLNQGTDFLVDSFACIFDE